MDSQNLQSFMLPSGNYGYTGTNIDTLNFENTIITGLLDESGSTRDYATQMEGALKSLIRSLAFCPVADRLLYRHCHFGTNFREVHGYKLLSECRESDYDNIWTNGGQTALYNSCDRVIVEAVDYAEKQAAKKYTVNGLIYIITDGQNYLSSGQSLKQDDVKLSLAKAIANESLESLLTILIGVNSDPGVRKDLEDFQKNVGFSQFVPIENADEKTLAKLANFISKSVQSQSQKVGSGGPSNPLPLTF